MADTTNNTPTDFCRSYEQFDFRIVEQPSTAADSNADVGILIVPPRSTKRKSVAPRFETTTPSAPANKNIALPLRQPQPQQPQGFIQNRNYHNAIKEALINLKMSQYWAWAVVTSDTLRWRVSPKGKSEFARTAPETVAKGELLRVCQPMEEMIDGQGLRRYVVQNFTVDSELGYVVNYWVCADALAGFTADPQAAIENKRRVLSSSSSSSVASIPSNVVSADALAAALVHVVATTNPSD